MSDSKNNLRTKWLVLVPTEFERSLASRCWPTERYGKLEVCGFGAIVAAARTIQLVQRYQPSRVLLLGIAGSLCPLLTVGQAVRFSTVGCYGIGVGTGSLFQSANQMGWPQWAGDETTPAISDRIELRIDSSHDSPLVPPPAQNFLLTAMASSANEDDVAQRLSAFPQAVAEDMEGFAVAAACQLSSVPLTIVRGISNQAGDRDHANWLIECALKEAVQLSLQTMSDEK